MWIRSYGKAAILALFAIAIVSAGCKHPQATPPAPAAPPPAAPAQPTVTLQSSSTMIQLGQQATLTWSSTNATNLTIAPDVGTVAPAGTTTVTPQDSVTYTITAAGPGGSATASVRITVSAPTPPAPMGTVAPTIEELFNQQVQDAYFDLDKADIRDDARGALRKTAQFLSDHPEVKVVIEGHCDERGSTEYNLVLGDRRAAAVKQFLVSLGISADRLNTVSYGKEKPFCTEHDESCWQQNRRGHFVLAK